jgi:hypothetical protein
MADVFRFPDRPPPAQPKSDHVATFFTVTGAAGSPLRCAAYEVVTGLELRLAYEDNGDLLRSQLFRNVDRDELVAEMADGWRRLLIAKGFSERKTHAAWWITRASDASRTGLDSALPGSSLAARQRAVHRS